MNLPIEKPLEYDGPPLTAVQFIEDTVAWFDGHPERLSVDEGQCCYRTDDGRSCAIGRWLVDYKGQMEGSTIHSVIEACGPRVLHPAIRHLPLHVLTRAQSLHDMLGIGDIREVFEDRLKRAMDEAAEHDRLHRT